MQIVLYLSSKAVIRSLFLLYIWMTVAIGKIRNDIEKVSILKDLLAKEFDIQDFRPLRYFLEIEIARSAKSIFISQ